MNKGTFIGIFVVIIILITGFSTCGIDRIGAGHVGIKVNLAGDQRGVSDFPAATGWVFYNRFTTQVYEYPTFMQTAKWTASLHEGAALNEEISFNTKDGVKITGDLSVAYTLQTEKIPHFYVKFRSDDLETFTHGYLRNVTRNAFTALGEKYTAEEVYATKTEALLIDVRSRLKSELDSIGVNLDQLGFIGAPRPPEQIIAAINGKVAATQEAQRTLNEVAMVQAQAQKAIAKAEGEAKANQIMTASITPNLLEWRRLQLHQMEIEKWNGALSQVQGSGQGMFLQIPQPGR